MDDEAKTLFNYLLLRFVSQTKRSELRAEYKINGTVPDFDHDEASALPLAPYQRVGLMGIMHEESTALFMEQGTGKTPVVIARICNEAKQQDNMYLCIVVAPKNVRTNWRTELLRFATTPGKVCILRGTKIDRVTQLIGAIREEPGCKWVVVVASYEAVTQSWDAIKRIPWDLGVLDESHYIKSPATQRYKTMIKLRDNCKARCVLTGTPITNSIMDLYGQFEFLGKGLSGFSSWRAFRTYHGRYERTDSGRQVLISYKHVPMLQERLSRLAFLIGKNEAMPDLPDKVRDIYEVEMSPTQSEWYQKLATQLALEIEDELNKGEHKELVVQHILTRLLRLAQITSGFVVWDAQYDEATGDEKTPKQVDRLDPNPKLETLVELVKEHKNPHEKVLVWACFIQDIKSISARLRLEGIDNVTFYGATSDKDRDTAVERFNNDQTCRVFIGNPAAGGTGLNLRGYNPDNPHDPCNCTHVVYYSQNWSMTARAQSEDRAHRRGTRTNVRITDLCIPETIDEEIRARVLDKRMTAYRIQDIRDILKRVING